MQITLSDEEVREALFEAAKKQTDKLGQTLDPEQCFLNVTGPDGDMPDIEEVTFTAVL